MPRQASHCPSVHLFAAALLAAFTLSATSVSADTFRVVTTSDEAPSSAVCDSVEAPGPNACSLRTAINAANLSPEIDTIDFALTAEDQNADGLYVIELDDELPAFKAPVILDATTQAGYAGRPVVALDAGPLLVSWGIYLSEGLSSDPGAHGSEVRGLAIYGATSYAIHLDRVDGCLVADNHVGLDLANVAVGNRNTGVRIFAGSGNTLRRNVIVASGGLGVDVRSQSGNPALDNALLDNVLGASAPLPAGIDDPPRVLAGNDIGLGVFGDGTLVEGNTAVGNVVGIQILASGVVVVDNYVGTDAAGTTGLGNVHHGVEVIGGAGNVIGAPGHGNVISGNGEDPGGTVNGEGDGVHIRTVTVTPAPDADPAYLHQPMRVEGNLVGTDPTGTAALPNGGDGVELSSVLGTSGGPLGAVVVGNVLSGNLGYGLVLQSSDFCAVEDNRVGTDADGAAPIGNALGGVRVNGFSNDDRVGRDEAAGEGAGNTIAFNGGPGIALYNSGARRILIGQNAIHDNGGADPEGGLGIDLVSFGSVPDGVTANSANGQPNGLQDFPVLARVEGVGGGTLVEGTLGGAAGLHRVEVFASPTADPSGHGEGERYLGGFDVTVAGETAFSAWLPAVIVAGEQITATAIDLGASSYGNTSELSAAIAAEVAREAPAVAITAPTPGAVFVVGEAVTFTATAIDFDGGVIAAAIVWTSDLDGPFGVGAAADGSLLGPGVHTITATVTDAFGLVGADAIPVEVALPPELSIASPTDGDGYALGQPVDLASVARDSAGNDAAHAVSWSSNVDGALGDGDQQVSLSLGTHTLTASLTDVATAVTVIDSVQIEVVSLLAVAIVEPGEGTQHSPTEPIAMLATATDASGADASQLVAWSSDRDGPLGSGVVQVSLSVGTHVITASLSDAAAGQTVAHSVTIEVIAAPDPNEAPVANDDTFTVDQGATVTGNVVAGGGPGGADTDGDGDALTATLVSGPAFAHTFSLGADGALVYRPRCDAPVTDQLTYRVHDGTEPSNTATVTIAITPIGDRFAELYDRLLAAGRPGMAVAVLGAYTLYRFGYTDAAANILGGVARFARLASGRFLEPALAAEIVGGADHLAELIAACPAG